MNIIEQYIEMNNEVLSKLTRENPELGTGIIDTLAVLSNYIKDNDVQFTAEQTSKILQKVEEVQSEEEEKKEQQLKIAEDKSKEIQQAVQKVDETDLDNILCTYVWVRGGGANLKVNTYFALGVTEGSQAESIYISTYLKNDVFTRNPTPQNKLVRDVFISTGRLKYADIGVWIWNLSDRAIKSMDAKNLVDNPNFIGGYTNKVIAMSEATKESLKPRLFIDKTRRDAIELFTQGTNGVLLNKKQYIFDYIRTLKNPYLLDIALNTLQMVAWAEGINLGLRTTTDFMDLGSYYNDVVRDSKADNQRLYLILSRDTTASGDAELSSAFGSSLAQGIVQSKGENNAFIVGILVDGVFQNEIDPYIFSQAVAQPQQVTNQNVAKTKIFVTKRAKEASEITTENVYVVQLKDDSYAYEVGEDNLFNLEDTNQLKKIQAVYKEGVEVNNQMPIRKKTKQTISFTKDVLKTPSQVSQTIALLQKGLLEIPKYSVIFQGKGLEFKLKQPLIEFLVENTSKENILTMSEGDMINIPKNSSKSEIEKLVENLGKKVTPQQFKENISDVFVETTDELTDEDLEGLDNMDDLGEIELEDLEDLPDLDFEQE